MTSKTEDFWKDTEDSLKKGSDIDWEKLESDLEENSDTVATDPQETTPSKIENIEDEDEKNFEIREVEHTPDMPDNYRIKTIDGERYITNSADKRVSKKYLEIEEFVYGNQTIFIGQPKNAISAEIVLLMPKSADGIFKESDLNIHGLMYDDELELLLTKTGSCVYIIGDGCLKPISKGYHEIYLNGETLYGQIGAKKERIVLGETDPKDRFSSVTSLKKKRKKEEAPEEEKRETEIPDRLKKKYKHNLVGAKELLPRRDHSDSIRGISPKNMIILEDIKYKSGEILVLKKITRFFRKLINRVF